MPKTKSKNNLYDNCHLYSPDGTLIALCGSKKIMWYLRKGLGEKISDEPLSLKLNFEPKAMGNADDVFYLTPRENKCVTCGSSESLTNHHVIPNCFIKALPERYKINNSHDVLLLCISCHSEYEIEADSLKISYAEKYKVSLQSGPKPNFDMRHYQAIQFSQKLRDNIDLHPKLKKSMLLYIGGYLGVSPRDLKKEDIENLANSKPSKLPGKFLKTFGEKVIDKVMKSGPSKEEALFGFFKMWRLHFIITMKPKFMPKHWRCDKYVWEKIK